MAAPSVAAMTLPFDLPATSTGTVAAVTGASRGLGAALAARFAARGMALGLCARTEPAVPDGAAPDAVVTAAVDVRDAAAVDAFAAHVAATLGPVDLWVNNAGVIGPIDPARDSDPDEIHDALLINIGGVMHGSAAFARAARQAPPARRVLVNISSGAATSVYPGWSTYGPTKAAVDHYSRIVAVEEPDLVVYAVAPGVVDTDMQAAIRASDPAAFPARPRFEAMHRDGTWNDPAWIADHLAGLLHGSYRPDDVVIRIPDAPR